MFENMEQMIAGNLSKIDGNKLAGEAKKGIADLMANYKTPILRVSNFETLRFDFMDLKGAVKVSHDMYNLMIESARTSSNMIQRMQLEASLKLNAIREIVLKASDGAANSIIEYLDKIQPVEGLPRFLIFGQLMGELKVFIFEQSSHPIGNQISEVSENEILEIFNFQKDSEKLEGEEE